jgi:hypothetical protein
MEIQPIDPRTLKLTGEALGYCVIFWQIRESPANLMAAEWHVSGAQDVQEVISWAESAKRKAEAENPDWAHSYELFVIAPNEDVVKLGGVDPTRSHYAEENG